MKVTSLVDNLANEGFLSEHGISLYIETGNHKILFDTGKTDVFLRNASILNIPIEKITHLVLSHGHYDHGGGIIPFFIRNENAKVYVQPSAFRDRYSLQKDGTYKYIGLDPSLQRHDRFVKINEFTTINSSLLLFANASRNYPTPTGNNTLFQKVKEKYEHDDFSDEQYLLVEEYGKTFLFTGCSHKGILNILTKAEEIKNKKIDYLFGGFHLYSNSLKISEDDESILKLADELVKHKTKYYTMHCTGEAPYNLLKSVMKDQVHYLKAGSITIL